MTDIQNERVVLAARPEGRPRPSDFRHETVPLPGPGEGEGEVLLETAFLSLDPYLRGLMSEPRPYGDRIGIGEVLAGEVVARVRQSRHPDWREGDTVLSHSGWQRFAISDGTGLSRIDPAIAPVSAALGVLGMPGFTAYAGLRNIGRPRPGETVVVAAASGAVGSAVGQIARIGGARAVGITTGRDKLAYVKDELGFDAVVDHAAPDFAEALARACPDGIDVYFELIGGKVWDAVLPLLNPYARIPLCGQTAHYNDASRGGGADRLPGTMHELLYRSVTVRGFIQTEFAEAQRPDFLREATAWVAEGRLRWREDVVQGLEKAPEAFIGLLEGGNFGKPVVRLGEG
ncbi:zinc-binding dehydrogenase [Pararoseomonas sp. SCSIO 73927]|uniref:NADP-dependent oxidoreductase n=1 Tax=Pararoseomonas sp. SCSIO 73927 TaxID=3114537 RepID=UPI0030D4C033